MKQEIQVSHHQEKFQDIIKLLKKIDDSFKEKGVKNGVKEFDLASVGHEMMHSNSEFYREGVNLGRESFSTLAT